MTTLAILVAALTLAFANGANDNFKGVATLHGSGRLPYPGALALATLTTLAGSLSALVLAGGLARRFSGKGLVPESVVADPIFLLAVAVGAAATVLLATRVGLPVSTTHALSGALLGAGVAVAGAAQVSYGVLTTSIALPLLLSPLVSVALAAALHGVMSRAVTSLESSQAACLCGLEGAEVATVGPAGHLVRVEAGPRLHVASVETCERHGAARLFTLAPRRVLDGLHLASAGAVSFARGLNDTPKLAGLLVAVPMLGGGIDVLMLAAAIGLGGLLAARRVARTLSVGITRMDEHEGLSANLVTAGLVVVASPLGLPVSTTHVSCGALFGIGISRGEARWRTIGSILGAWAVTLPAGAFFAALAAAGLAAIR